jgi:hypothetical protein
VKTEDEDENEFEASFAPLRRALSTLSHRLARDAGDFGRDVGFAESGRFASATNELPLPFP